MRKRIVAPNLPLRERQILVRLVHGMQIRHIASHLGLAKSTVENYITNLYARIGVTNAIDASIYCMEKVWTDAERCTWFGSVRMYCFANVALEVSPRQARLLDYLVEEPSLTREEVAKHLGVSVYTVDDDMDGVAVRCFPRHPNRWPRSRRVLLATHWWAVWTW